MPGKQKGGADIRIHHLIVFCGAGVNQVFIVANTDVIDQDIQATECSCGCGHALLGYLLLSSIADNAYSLAPGLLHGGFQFFQPPLPARCQNHICPFLG